MSLLLCDLTVVTSAQVASGLPLSNQTNQIGDRSKQKGKTPVKVPVTTLPGRRENGGTRRGGCMSSDPALLALLLPSTNLGLTTAAYPRFFWYTPKNTAQSAQFFLYQVDEKLQKRQLVYKTTFKPNMQAGITSFVLPNNGKIPPLKVNQNYQWSVSLICDLEDPSPSSVINVYGWVQRVALNQDLVKQLQNLSPRERISVYAENGLWFDLVTTLAELRACKPPETKLEDFWSSMLQQVELQELTHQPLQQKCSLKTR